MSVVVDTSMAVAWLFRDERSELPQAVLRRVVQEGALVPSLWRLEVANVLRNAVRRKRCDERYVTRCLDRLGRLAIEVDDETDLRAWSDIRRVSMRYDLTIYDAAYLELALRRDRPLASGDTALIKAGKSLKIEVLGA